MLNLVIAICVIGVHNQSPAAPPMKGWTKITHVVHAYANFGPGDRQIVFQSNAAGNYDLYIMNADGSGLKRLIDSPADDITPVFSPSGSHIAFVSERDGNREIYLCDPSGKNLKRITDNPGSDIHPMFNADGSRIIFSSNRGNLNRDDFDIYEMAIDGSDVKRITSGPDVDTYASWSPDGMMIVTRRVINGSNNEVFVMNSDGSNPRNLTNNAPAYDGWPVWSPDGQHIAFASGIMQNNNHCIYMIKPDGSGLTQLTAAPEGQTYCYNTQPSFSRDGKRLIYTMYRPGARESAELCIIHVPTTG